VGKRPREELIEEFMREISRNSTWTVMFHGAVAAKLGLNPTDLKCGGVLRETGPITAGELANLTGLTTGAITGVVDRLERTGFVQRTSDPNDRRRVIIEPLEEAGQNEEAMRLFGPLAEATVSKLLTHYSGEEMEIILDFVRRSGAMMKEQTALLQQRR